MILQNSKFIIYAVAEDSLLVRVGQGHRDGAYVVTLDERDDWPTFKKLYLMSSTRLVRFQDAGIVGIPTDLGEFEIRSKPKAKQFGSDLVFRGASIREGLVLLVLAMPPTSLSTMEVKMLGFQRVDAELVPCPVPDCRSMRNVTTPLCALHWSMVGTKEKRAWWLLALEEREEKLEALWKKNCIIKTPKPGKTVTLPGGSTIEMAVATASKKKPRALL